MYSYAQQRFPQNLLFVRGMLTYLASQKDLTPWAQLSAQYYFADRSIREPFLAYLSKNNQLRDRYATARGRVSGVGGQGGNPNPTSGPRPPAPGPYAVFAADAALWLSHHNE